MKIATLLLCLIGLLPQIQTASNQTSSQLRAEMARLGKKVDPTEAERRRYLELVQMFEYVPSTPEKQCITWDQHVAEVTSWWAAPERVYVRCDDPRVGPPKEKP